ncbi:MAG: hypothetical protein A2075_04250 [Geobacteraceae bacterium GWC2_58_44]|nr:MAG: hypothetical protein A2075_04250 [Geobacteraceae bacterium GWC2_58_44]HBG06064.1 hypothetical protein [Geobacter sp.]
MNITWLDTDKLFPAAIETLVEPDVVLDIGCGIMPQKYVRPRVHICCEPFGQYVEHLQQKVALEYDRSYVVVNAPWSEAVKIFPPKSVDTVFLVDVIEHLEKSEALDLLRRTEALARKQVVLFTPLGFLPQEDLDGKDAWGLDGGAWQEHKSGWSPEDFDASWRIYASKVFHTADCFGRAFETPYGAMWAIKDVAGTNHSRAVGTESAKIRKLLDFVGEVSVPVLLNLFLSLKITLKVKPKPLRTIRNRLFRK